MLESKSPDQPYLRERYDRIREGMTLAEVRRIMGGHGEMVSALHTAAVPGVRAPIDTTMVKWENPDGGNCHVMFQNGVVVDVYKRQPLRSPPTGRLSPNQPLTYR